METNIISLNSINISQAAEEAGRVLKAGGITAFPTDTVYGLGAVCTDAEAVRKIFTAKGRPENKPLSILVSGPEQVKYLTDAISEAAEKLMEKFWPGALTLIFPIRKDSGIPDEVTAGGSTIGVRMPDSEIAVKIIAAAGMPVAAPSANTSGKRSAANAGDVIEDLSGKIDLIIDGGDCPIGLSSTVVDVSGDIIHILREGTVTRKMIEETTGKQVL